MMFTITLPEKISLNKIYAGVHFTKRQEHKAHYVGAVLEAKVPKYTGSFPIKVHYHFRCSGPRLDTSNYAYMLKMIEDALVARAIIPDDNPKYISEITISAEQIPKGQPHQVDVEFSPA